ncbi:MAG TPA: molybdopterin cofactor-binding domain-containing protein [Thermomicrobiales bacterium]|nr:molybdopterin cofactor-binding domain-containing protein [Thermomicrobiales bacterium]
MATTVDKPEQAEKYFGRGVKRVEDPRLITGQGNYTDDIAPTGTLYAAILRSPYAHARIRGIDVSGARQAPGVVAAFSGADLKDKVGGLPCGWLLPDMKMPVHPALAFDTVRHVGDGVAVVVATERYLARDALERIRVDYEPLSAVTDAEQALKEGAPLVHDDVPSNKAFEWGIAGGDFAKAAAEADVVIKQRMVNQRLIPNAVEPRAVTAEYNRGTDELTVFTSTQIPHLVRLLLALTMGLPEQKIRIVAPDVGGGFGSKLYLYAEEVICAYLARELNRPVKWNEGRSENYLATTHGRDHIEDVEVAAKSDGTVTGLKVTTYANLGAYLSTFAPGIPTILFGLMLSGNYTIPNIDCKVYGALTNTTPVDAYRGAGRPEATYVVERVMDLVADETGVDPADVRRKNYIQPEAFPFTTATTVTYDSGNYAGTLDKALDLVGYADLRKRQEELRQHGRHLGIGLCTYVEICGMAPSQVLGAVGGQAGGWESATVRVHPTGKVSVFTGSSSHGQGHETSFAQIVADELGVPMEDIEVIHGDTGRVQFGIGTFGSRSMAVGGIAIKMSTDKIVQKGKKIAAHLLEAAEEDIEFAGGQFNVKGAPERSKTFGDIALMAYLAHNYPANLEPGLEAQSFYDPSNFTWPFGTHIAVVEVDPDTGRVDLQRYVAVDDCGNVINPLLAAGQVQGGITQGLAQALYEGAVYDEQGQLVTGSLMDYAVPKAVDVPTYETAHTVTPSPVNPLGVKGIGEAGTIVSAPTVVNAVIDALSPLGIRHLDMPLTPEKIWRAMQATSNE